MRFTNINTLYGYLPITRLSLRASTFIAGAAVDIFAAASTYIWMARVSGTVQADRAHPLTYSYSSLTGLI